MIIQSPEVSPILLGYREVMQNSADMTVIFEDLGVSGVKHTYVCNLEGVCQVTDI
jgi:hypothetical protein